MKQPEWSDTLFGRLVLPRLAKEMSREDIELLYQRDKAEPRCVLCLVNVPPASNGLALCYHHISSRAASGSNVLSNLAPACPFHHAEPIASFRELWQRAMCKTNKAEMKDYGLEPWLFPPLHECEGFYGYGKGFYATGIPVIVQKLFAGKEDARLDDFCGFLCPVYLDCIKQTRVRKYKEIAHG